MRRLHGKLVSSSSPLSHQLGSSREGEDSPNNINRLAKSFMSIVVRARLFFNLRDDSHQVFNGFDLTVLSF